ncbi:MAG: hypothetical protein AAGC65_15715 [Mucilaginibacter sp.]|uniref:hypothetical protein n=1 Tax=Mucilaginibacter sp. TaxID=1882438 RepID=UPI0031B1FCAC
MKYLVYIITSATLAFSGCGGKKNNPTAASPSVATLLFPEQNSLCITGTVISGNQNSVVFNWKAADNADSYDISVKNLLTGISISQSINQPQATVVLSRNTPYSWFVTAKSSKNTATSKSDTWKFYNSGAGVTSYAPFPADKLLPSQSQDVNASAGKITLSWIGSDTDNDIIGYDVYLSTSSTPTLYQKNVVTNSLDISVTSATKYYWKVITHDAAGNSSESDLITFSVN